MRLVDSEGDEKKGERTVGSEEDSGCGDVTLVGGRQRKPVSILSLFGPIVPLLRGEEDFWKKTQAGISSALELLQTMRSSAQEGGHSQNQTVLRNIGYVKHEGERDDEHQKHT